MADNDAEKTEEATQARREDFRKKGQVVNSRELGNCLFILGSAAAIFVLGRFFFTELYAIFKYSFGPDMAVMVRQGDILAMAKMAGAKTLLLIAPVFGISAIIGIGSTVLQTGFLNVEDALTPKFEKIDPIAGFKRMFSLKTVVEALKAILKLIFIGAIVLMIIKSEVMHLPYLVEYSVEQLFEYLGSITIRLLGGIGMALGVLTVADYFFQRWDLDKKMMMTKQEVKEEHKSREGDPMIKARIRKIQREMSNRRMMDKVPQADVIITNPTHIAIALKYDANLPAPQLIAKGADLIAEKIRAIAKEHNIPIVENKPLARTMYKTMKLGQVIPKELFVAVAEVLSYVYKLRRKARRS